jgi:exosortase A
MIMISSMNRHINLHILLLVLGLVGLVVVWFDSLRHMVEIIWTVDTFSHGVFVPFISASLVWSRYEQLRFVPKAFCLWGGVVILAASCLWLVGVAAELRLLEHVAFVTMIQGLIITTLGPRFYRSILFPSLFLYMMVPFGDEIVTPLQLITADTVISLLGLLGIEYQAEGVLITLSSGVYEVARACAGVRFFFTSLVTGVLLSHLVFKSIWRKIAILLAAIIVPVFANIIRVLTILLIAENTDQSFAKDVDHIVYGWGFLSVVLLILIAIAYRFSDIDLRANTKAENPVLREDKSEYHSGKIVIVIMLVFVPLLAMQLVPQPAAKDITSWQPIRLDCDDCGYRVLKDPVRSYVPRFYELDQKQAVTVRRGADFIHAFQGGYYHQSGRHSLLGYYGALEADEWQRLPSALTGSLVINGVEFQEKILWRGNERMLLLYSYQVNHRWTANENWQVKLYNAISRLFYDKTPASIIVAVTRIGEDRTYARRLLEGYFRAIDIKHAGGQG